MSALETVMKADRSCYGEAELIRKYGEPYYINGNTVTAINQAYWAGQSQAEHIQLYEPLEEVFYRYNPESGLYSPISEDLLKQEVSMRILEVSRELKMPSLETKRTNATLNHVLAQLRGIAEKKGAFNGAKNYVHLANCMIVFGDNGEMTPEPFSPDFYSRNQSPIPYDEKAKCPRFENELLNPAVTPDDALLIQKYLGLALLGRNLPQRFLILDGLAGRGKSQLALIFEKIVGSCNVTELRTHHLDDRFELYRYLKKTLLVGVDVPGGFLMERGARVILALTGGDTKDSERKNRVESYPIKGDFCIVITSNSRLKIHLDGDIGPWKRRLLIIRFEAPAPAKKIPYFADLLIKEEGPGILNFALEGLRMTFKDIAERGDIHLAELQEDRIESLLAESDSLRHFLTECVISDPVGDLSSAEIVERYAEYCPQKGWNAKPITVVYRELEGLMLELFRVAKSNSIKRDGKSIRGFSRVMFREVGSDG